MNKSYEQLISEFVPRPISSEDEFWRVQKRIDSLVDLNRDWTQAEADYVSLLGMLIERYESDTLPEISLLGRDLISASIESEGITLKNLVGSVFESIEIAEAVLNGTQPITTEQCKKLASRFGYGNHIGLFMSFD